MKNLHFVLLMGLFFGLHSCCSEDSIILEGTLVNGITSELLSEIEINVEGRSRGGSFLFPGCPDVNEMAITDDVGAFSLDYTQAVVSTLSLASTNSIIFAFPNPTLRVTEQQSKRVWDNNETIINRNMQVLERPVVPNEDVNAAILVEVLPVIILSTHKTSDSTKTVNSLIIRDFDINFQGPLQNENLRFDRFIEEVQNEFLVEINYSNGESLDSIYSYDIFDASSANVIIEY